jgi:hypothetical protein
MRTWVVAVALVASVVAGTAPAAAQPDLLAPPPGDHAAAPSLLPREALGFDGPAQGFYPYLTGIGLPLGFPLAAATGGCGAFGFGFCPRFTGSYLSTFGVGSGVNPLLAPWLIGWPGFFGWPPLGIAIGIY